MAELSGYLTLRAVHEMVDEEVRRLIDAWRTLGPFTRPEHISRSWMLGSGARHAFGSESGRFRFVESLETDSELEGAEIPIPEEWATIFGSMKPALFEWINLAGVDLNYDIPGIDYRPTHRLGDKWVVDQNALREWVASTNSDESLLYRGIVSRRLSVLASEVASMTFHHGEIDSWFTGPTAGVAFISSLPTQQVITELLYAVHRQSDYTFRQHDRNDLNALALALPYCDVVVPDSHWAHHAIAMRLADEYNTLVLRGQKQLAAWAANLDQAS